MSGWKDTLRELAPTVAGALGGPFAMTAVNIVADLLGVEADEKKVGDLVASGDPDVLLKLREGEQKFKVEMRRLGVEQSRIAGADRASARKSGDTVKHLPQMVLGVVYTGGFIWLLVSLFTGVIEVAPEQQQIANILLGMLGAGQAQVLNYFFGSTTGSKDKTYSIERMNQKVGS